MISLLTLAMLAFVCVAFFLGRRQAIMRAGRAGRKLHSRPSYHGIFLALVSAGPALLLILFWSWLAPIVEGKAVLSLFADQLADMGLPQQEAFLRDARALAFGGIVGFSDQTKEAAAEVFGNLHRWSNAILVTLALFLALAGFVYGRGRIDVAFRARHVVERTFRVFLIVCSTVAIVTTIGIVLSLLFESIRFFQKVPFFNFLFGLHWSPQGAFTGAGAEATGANADVFGAVPLFAGTLLITVIAMAVAAPIGLMAAIYLSDYASSRVRAFAKPMLEILAGIPTVVYGFFAALTVAPFFRRTGEAVGLDVSSESALAAGVVMGIMIIPFVSSLSDDVINAVPQSLRDGSAGLGATKSETIRKVVLPAALPGIVSALLLAVSRAIGETMIVVMAAGLAANLTANPLEAVTTVTVQIVTLLVGDQEFDSAKTLAAFALGLVLFAITLTLNIVALRVVQKYREQYD
ncbi:phosphate ABC transporter permease subunit PstC [Oricola cellulosilytica]|uniref:Phosphate transport system permease protein n=1 Tax=Oricola cellulosilytica TaxID=1429082 RepID=A0A4R0PF85_9HYPH|nr:phosphate ABC transporter permease subunit PstC [Oricola cellulosilytica]TCD16495.1 phosphate ABC transporter permease subunit PstC [Oricola cellulosilytica]